MKRPRSISRLQAREAEKKVTPAIKILSTYMHNTSPDTPGNVFHGYEIPAGDFTDSKNRVWQLQVRAVMDKSLFIKKNEIKPIIRKWAVGFKVRLFFKLFIDKIFFSDEKSI